MAEVTGIAAAIAVESAPLRIVDRLFDHENPATLGLEAIPGDHTVVCRATEANFTFSHQQNIGAFAGRLYLMWSNCITHEDHNGQRILYAHLYIAYSINKEDEGVTRILLNELQASP